MFDHPLTRHALWAVALILIAALAAMALRPEAADDISFVLIVAATMSAIAAMTITGLRR